MYIVLDNLACCFNTSKLHGSLLEIRLSGNRTWISLASSVLEQVILITGLTFRPLTELLVIIVK